MLKLYGNLESCPKCRIVHQKLTEKGIGFIFIEDIATVESVAKEVGVASIPFAIKEDKVLGFTDLIKLGV